MAYSYRTPHRAAGCLRGATSSTLTSARRGRLLVALVALVALPALACTVKITDFQSSDSDSDSESSSDSGATDSGATDTGDTPDVDCGQDGAKADVKVTWDVEKMICESEESCDATQSVLCTVEAIDIGDTTEVSLACEDPDLGPVSATLAIDVSSPGELDLAEGAKVTLEDRHILGFEVQNGNAVRVIDETGVVVAAVEIDNYGGQVDKPWMDNYLSSTVAPLTGEAALTVCGGEPSRGALKVAQLDAEVWVPSGGDDVLVGDRQWSVTVEAATHGTDGHGGDIDVVVMRIKP